MGKISKIPHEGWGREDWLAQRRELQGVGDYETVRFGSSDIGTILYGQFDSKVRLFYNYLGKYITDVPSYKMELALKLEDLNALSYESYVGDPEEFARNFQNGTKLASLRKVNYFLVNEDYPYLSSSLDRIREPGSIDWSTGEVTKEQMIVELKAPSHNSFSSWGGQPPMYYRVQCEQQMIVSETYECDLACLVGGDYYVVYRVYSDDRLRQRVIDETNDFAARILTAKAWMKYGDESGDQEKADEEIKKLEPPITYSEHDTTFLLEMYGYDTSDSTLVEGNEFTDLMCYRYLRANEVIKVAEKYKQLAKNRLIRYCEDSNGAKTESYQYTKFSKTGSNLFKVRSLT